MEPQVNRIIQNQVDLILYDEGSFSPLSWLLREGHLKYVDYQNWRKGKAAYLEDHFNSAASEILLALAIARDYATSLNLDSTNQRYTSIANEALQFSRSPEKELLFTTVYEPLQNRVQLDLFFDSAPVCIESDLVAAIINQHDEIPDLLAKLKPSNPEQHKQFERLLTYKNNILQDKYPINKKIELMSETLTLLAFELLGRFSHDFLTPLWQKLSAEIGDQRFAAKQPKFHLSFTAFRSFQWPQVLSSIEHEKDWVNQPALIFRYAEACFKLNEEQRGLENWFRLFLLFPETAERLIADTSNRVMFYDWQNFTELDPELEPDLFPAWMVMKKPALAAILGYSDIAVNEPLYLIENLVSKTNTGLSDNPIHIRARLQKSNPDLFAHYMRAMNKA